MTSETNAPQPNPWIANLPIYTAGEGKISGVEQPARLAANEGALGPSAKAKQAVIDLAGALHRYPDGSFRTLREAIHDRYGLDPDRLLFGAGSDEILSLIARAYLGPESEALYSQHGFLMYPIMAKSVGAAVARAPETDRRADVDALLAAVTDRTKVLFLANPNNPTGSYLTADEVRRLHAGLRPDILLVLDGAYAEFVLEDDYDSGVALASEMDNVIMTRTFSKLHALAGLRLGWAYGPPDVIEALNRLSDPFNVNAVAVAAGTASMKDSDFLQRSIDHNTQWVGWLRGQLGQLGIDAAPSAGNFVLADFAAWGERGMDDPAETARLFLRERGILVRQVPNYGLPTCLRISIGLEHEMRAVIDGLGTLAADRFPDL